MLALAPDTFGPFPWPVADPEAWLPPPAPATAPPRVAGCSPAFLRSIGPALDHAYGLDRSGDMPEDMAGFVARLQAAGPVTPPAREPAAG